MTKNPYLNALCATAYISLVALLMSNGERLFGAEDNELLIPIAMISLLVLSASLMGYIFFYHPAQMYVDGDKKGAINLFGKTLGTFAVFTVLAFVSLFLLR